MHDSSRIAGMERGGHPGYHVPATSPLAPMVNRVLTSRYLWWFVPFPPRSKGDEWPFGVSAFIVWL